MKGTTKAETWQDAMEEFDRAERAQKGRDKSNGVTESFDSCMNRDELEMKCVNPYHSPAKVLERKEAYHILNETLESLTITQRRRIAQSVLEQKSYSEIAKLEGVDESAVRRSVKRGLLQLKMRLIGTSMSENDFSKPSQTRYVKHYHPKKETADRQNGKASLINLTGAPKKSATFWGEEAQRNERGMTLKSRSERYEACADERGAQYGE